MIVLRPEDWEAAETARAEGSGQLEAVANVTQRAQRTLWGVPVVVSNALPRGRAWSSTGRPSSSTPTTWWTSGGVRRSRTTSRRTSSGPVSSRVTPRWCPSRWASSAWQRSLLRSPETSRRLVPAWSRAVLCHSRTAQRPRPDGYRAGPLPMSGAVSVHWGRPRASRISTRPEPANRFELSVRIQVLVVELACKSSARRAGKESLVCRSVWLCHVRLPLVLVGPRPGYYGKGAGQPEPRRTGGTRNELGRPAADQPRKGASDSRISVSGEPMALRSRSRASRRSSRSPPGPTTISRIAGWPSSVSGKWSFT